MLKAELGAEESTFTVYGLPPLELRVGKDGFFDGFITLATGMDHMWLMPTFNSKLAIDSAAALFRHEPLNIIQKGSLAIVRLQYKNNTMSWTRVIIENRPDPVHAIVYLIDSGGRQMVNARNLYNMPLEMKRFPPQAFPILPKIPASPDLAPGEWERLANVRITVRMNAVKDNKFVCDQLTVYEAVTRADLDFGTAIRSGIELERSNTSFITMDDKQYSILGAPHNGFNKDALLLDQKRQDQRDFSVVLVCTFGLLMAMVSIILIIGYTYRRVQVDRERRRRRENPPERPAPVNDTPSWLIEEMCRDVQPTPLATMDDYVNKSTKTVENRKEEHSAPTEAPVYEKNVAERSILALSPKAIAVIAALMGSSSAIIDGQLSRTIAIQTGKENSSPDISFEDQHRIGAGISEISSIRGSSLPRGYFVRSSIETSGQRSIRRPSRKSEQHSLSHRREQKTTSYSSNSSFNDDFFESVTSNDVQQMLRERAILRGEALPVSMDSSFSSFYSAVSYHDNVT